MRMVRREHRALLVLLAVLIAATAWSAFGHQSATASHRSTETARSTHADGGTISPADLSDSVAVPMLGALRTAEPRLAPLWALPGLAAALAALCLLRRLRRSPSLLARRALLRGTVANRAPPLASFA
jgi:hypothetical protein